MNWVLFRRSEYYPFDVALTLSAYAHGKNRAVRWRFRNLFAYCKDKSVHSFRGQPDLASAKVYLQVNFSKQFAARVGREIRKAADNLFTVTKKTFRNKATLKSHFSDFCEAYGRLMSIFNTPELAQMLIPTKDKKLLKNFGLARDYAARILVKLESVYRRRLGPFMHIPQRAALYMTPDEVKNFLQSGEYPPRLYARKSCAVLVLGGRVKIFWNEQADQIFQEAYGKERKKLSAVKRLSGQTAYPGIAKGVAYVAITDADFKRIPQKSILVCSMTRYSVVPYLRRVSAIVTDQGGITCHAAIICRELKVPTLTGTSHATEALKTGDRVEVNANHGWVRKLF